ncbi:MAG: WhiB family transcriptional regulator [Streptosporangiaceae bacterium]
MSSAAACAPQIAAAKAICADCQVRQQCLRFAVSTGQAHEIWGGTTEEERARLRLAQAVPLIQLPDPGAAIPVQLTYLLAVLAACANAASSVLQRKANRDVPQRENLSWKWRARIVVEDHLAKHHRQPRPRWPRPPHQLACTMSGHQARLNYAERGARAQPAAPAARPAPPHPVPPGSAMI